MDLLDRQVAVNTMDLERYPTQSRLLCLLYGPPSSDLPGDSAVRWRLATGEMRLATGKVSDVQKQVFMLPANGCREWLLLLQRRWRRRWQGLAQRQP